MTSADSNAFFGADRADRQNNGGGSPVRNLASSLAPLHASLEKTEHGWMLQLSPMRAFDALKLWSMLWDEGRSNVLTFDVAMRSPMFPRTLSSPGDDGPPSLRLLAEQFGISAIAAFSDDALVVDDLTSRELAGLVPVTRWRSVFVDGPIEPRDAAAIAKAVKREISPLAVEVRAVASMTVDNDRIVRLESPEKRPALLLIAENFRHYLAALRGRPVSEFVAPEPWQIERLLSLTGSLTVRPIETDVFSTFMDIGISTAATGASEPADRSLIYDLPSNSWHDEP